ncbi:unnamed protein product [Arabis nemorensis]|uniref:Uncharacterized protein n=1 Tax=Arabis nemorensis TaxID=586526 RepID=A0A565C6U2_9BRAS|nr:unnamed protein product [Arabis nemorensis]
MASKLLNLIVRPVDKRTLEALKESRMASEMESCSVGFLEELIVILEFQEKGIRQPDRLKQIAHEICLLFLSSTSNDLNALVAMDRHMKVVYDLLTSQVANKEVRTLGISGTAGVGKTTLGRYIYAEISVNFQAHVFVENVENMKDKILNFEREEDPTVITSLDHHWHEITESRRAPGSIVILISQNKNLLVDAGVMDVYEVRSLRYDEALQLFSHFAFKQPYSPCDFEQLAVRAVHLAGFLPLALRLLGSFFNGKGREEWLTALLKLKAKRGGNVMEVWKLMEPSQDKGQEEWEAAADIMKANESSKDKGQEEAEASADKMNLKGMNHQKIKIRRRRKLLQTK